MTSTQIILIIDGILVVIALAAAAWYVQRRRSLRRRFGPEYDRMVAEREDRQAAERELHERERKHAELELRPLSAESRATYAAVLSCSSGEIAIPRTRSVRREIISSPRSSMNGRDTTRSVSSRHSSAS